MATKSLCAWSSSARSLVLVKQAPSESNRETMPRQTVPSQPGLRDSVLRGLVLHYSMLVGSPLRGSVLHEVVSVFWPASSVVLA
jgi:hypothetical protein